ncbi:MAG TPA: AAA family ATPase [Candidatus Elarobacter sp.]|nr:AAA family ATPase [Candidatus Elarobacter sp.]
MDVHRTATRISLFGKPALFVDGRLQPFRGPRKATALLAYLLLHRDRVLSRAAVAEQFWPDDDDPSARAALRRHLHRALSALPDAAPGRPWVVGDKATLRWNPDASLDVDTVAYESLCAAGQREAAAGLYRGDYLEDFYDHWVLTERERLRELHAGNLIALADARRRALDYASAISFAQSLLRLDPLREDAIRLLMTLRFAAGDRAGALADFEAFARQLRDELQTDPMPETNALREAIRSNDLDTLAGLKPPAPHVARPAFPFAGRDSALKTLAHAWETAARGRAATAIVSGEAGIGKSRLIGELASLAETQGGRVMAGTTAAIETEPYQALAGALRDALPLLRIDRIEPAALAAISVLVPSLRERAPDLPVLPELASDRERRRFFDAVEIVVAHLAEKRPLLVILEDLHWAGATTIELLDSLVRRLSEKSILIVVSFREEEIGAHHSLREFVRRLDTRRSVHVALGPLDLDAVRALVDDALPDADRAQIAHDVLTAGDGNALFVTELLRERLNGADAGEGQTVAALPAGIARTVRARLDRLEPRSRALVEMAAVTGVGFDAEVVREACGWGFAEVFDGLDELHDRALVRMSPHRRGDYAFSHQLVHAAVYGAIDEPVRRALHRRVAKTLERLFPDRPSLCASIARHFDAAGLAEDAVARYLAAAQYALGVFAQTEAAGLATRGLELCTALRDRFELHRLREKASASAGDDTGRKTDCDAMLELAGRIGDDELLGTALLRTVTLLRERGERAAEHAAIVRLCDLGRRSGATRWVVEGALAQARFEINRADDEAAEAIFAAAEPHVAAVDDPALALEFWVARASTALGTPQARDCLERARPSIGDDALRRVKWLRGEANVADHEGDEHALFAVASELLERYREMGDVEGQASANLQLALCAWYRLEFVVAVDRSRLAVALFERVQKPNSVAAAVINRGVIAQRLGRFADAESDYRRALATSESLGQKATACLAMMNLASLASMRGEPEQARSLALEAVAHAREHGLAEREAVAMQYLGSAELELGECAAANEHLETALRYRRTRAFKGVLETLIEVIPARLGIGAYDAALDAAAELLQGLEGDRLRVKFPAKALAAAAAAYEAAGNGERAAALRAEARDLLREICRRLPDADCRAGYVSLPFHRAIAGEARVDALETVLP